MEELSTPGEHCVLTGKKALVIGGTGGIGRAVALGLAERGAELMIHGRSRERLERTLAELRTKGTKCDGFLLTIDKPEAAGKILDQYPDPDILVCAWGPFLRGALEDPDMDLWQKMADFNLVFPGILVSRVIRGMMERNWGRIVLFGGTNTDTIRGFTTTAAYSAAKTALGVVVKSAAKSAGSRGVTCNMVCPGLTDTEYTTSEQSRYHLEKNPGGKPLETTDIARMVLAVIDNSGINGAIIPVDRGVVL